MGTRRVKNVHLCKQYYITYKKTLRTIFGVLNSFVVVVMHRTSRYTDAKYNSKRSSRLQ